MKRGVLYALYAAILLTMVGCSKYKVASFVMPTWNTQLSAPIFNRTYTLDQMLSKDSVTVSNGDTTFLRPSGPLGTFELFKSQQINGVKIGDNLNINGVGPVYSSQSPNDFAIETPPPIHFVEVDPSLPAGTSAPAPAISPARKATLPPDQPFQSFTYATISSGTLEASLHNGYPATIRFQNGINVEDSSGNILLNIPVPGDSLASNQTIIDTVSMAGVTIPNNPEAVFGYSSPGSNGASVPFQSDTLMAITFNLRDIHVSSADAKVPPQAPVVLNETIHLADGNKVETAAIDTGSMDINIKNGFNFSSPVQLTIESLVDASGNPLVLNFDLGAAGTVGSDYHTDVSLQGYTLNMADAQGNPTDTVRYTVSARIPGSGGKFINIATTDSINSSFLLSDLKFSSFTGIVHLKSPVDISPDTQKVDLGSFASKFSGDITFSDSTKLLLEINKTGGFPWLVHLTLIPSNSSSSGPPVDSAVFNQTIYPNQVNVIRMGAVLVPALNKYSSVTHTVPDQFIISGHVIVNPTFVEGTIQTNDMMSGTATITMPLDIGISHATYVDTTTTPVINDSSTAAKLANVDSARVVFEINNGLPLGFSFISQLIDTATGQVVGTLPPDSIVIPAATEFNADGTVKSPMFSQRAVVLSHDEAVDLGRCYMRLVFRPRTGPNGQTVPFTENNTLSVRAFANLAFTVDKNLVGK